MGFGSTVKDLWEEYRGEFPVTARFVYLNHAAVAPLCKPAADSMKLLADDVWLYGSFHYEKWLEAYDGLRAAAARLIGAREREIAIVKNTSEGVATVASGLQWRRGDRIVCFSEEFPANLLPWQRLQSKGIRVDTLSIDDPLECVERAVRGARLLAVSFVQYLSGKRADLVQLGSVCRSHGCFFFVDAIQGLGAFPLDVEAARIDALAADGHKWMLGPEGCGILYVRESRLDEIEPVEFGWTNVADFNNYSQNGGLRLRADAGRYECGTLNTIGVFGLRAAINFLLQVGVDRIGPAVCRLADALHDGARAKGYEALGTRTPDTAAGIVSIRKPGLDCRMVVRKLKAEGILAAPRMGWARLSPHFYISPEEISRVIAALP